MPGLQQSSDQSDQLVGGSCVELEELTEDFQVNGMALREDGKGLFLVLEGQKCIPEKKKSGQFGTGLSKQVAALEMHGRVAHPVLMLHHMCTGCTACAQVAQHVLLLHILCSCCTTCARVAQHVLMLHSMCSC